MLSRTVFVKRRVRDDKTAFYEEQTAVFLLSDNEQRAMLEQLIIDERSVIKQCLYDEQIVNERRTNRDCTV